MPHAVILHDLLPGLVTRGLVRPLDEREGDGLVRLGVDRAVEVRGVPVGDIVAKRLHDAQGAVFAKDFRILTRELRVAVTAARWDGDNDAVDVAAACRAVFDDSL